MDKITSKAITLLTILLFSCAVSSASAQVATPQLVSARFDFQGRLLVKSKFEAIEGCYVAINGGLTASSVETGIIGTQLTAREAAAGVITIRTKRRYFCKKRKLFLNVELVCLNEVIGSATSSVRAVSVPDGNYSGR